MLKRLHHVINYQQIRSTIPCSRMAPVALWKSSECTLYGVLHDKLRKLLKEKVNQASLQR